VPKMFKETGAEAPSPAAANLGFTTTPFDAYKFAPIREATVSTASHCGVCNPYCKCFLPLQMTTAMCNLACAGWLNQC
jgi:hypothetical protein